MAELTVLSAGSSEKIRFQEGETLLSALRENGFSVKAVCGGNGRCGKCLVEIREDDGRYRALACKTKAKDGSVVVLERNEADLSWNDSGYVPSAFSAEDGLGAAIDLGTTSIAVSLFDLSTHRRLGTLGKWNAQQSWGADVISRIAFTMENKDGLSILSECVRSQIRQMIQSLCEENGRDSGELRRIFLAGNTTMQHLFAGLSPESIAGAPFEPLSYFSDGATTDFYGIPAFLSPCVSGYVGGDLTAGIASLKLEQKEGMHLLLDVGTNGEMILGGRDGFLSCAVACGPAFEGAGIACGMPAENGAVSRVFLTEEGLGYEVIGGGEARGFCGSGLLDLAACLLQLGYISPDGQLLCDGEEDGEAVFRLTENVILTAHDVRRLQLAKAAVAAGIAVLTEYRGIGYDEIDTLYLAGGFGNRLDPRSAAAIGMLPSPLLEKVKTAGNASLAGAEAALLSEADRSRLFRIREMCSTVELSGSEAFKERYIEELAFPEANFEE